MSPFQERHPDLAPEPVVRRSGRRLSLVIDQLASELDDNFLHAGGGAEEVLVAYAADHHHEPRL